MSTEKVERVLGDGAAGDINNPNPDSAPAPTERPASGNPKDDRPDA